MKQENSEIGKKVLTDGLDHCPIRSRTITTNGNQWEPIGTNGNQ